MVDANELPSTIAVEDDARYDGTTFSIGNGYLLNLQHDEDNLRLRIYPQSGDGQRYINNNLPRNFFESDYKIRDFGNDIAEDIGVQPKWVKKRLRDVRQYIEASEERLLSTEARDLMERVESVKAYQTPEDLTIAVWVEAPDESRIEGTRRLEFDGTEFEDNDADPLKQMHFQSFLVRLRIADEDWEFIRDEWLEELALEQTETQSPDDIIADRVTDVLSKQVSNKVFDDKTALRNDNKTAYYEPASESEYDEDTVWVQSPAIQDVVSDTTDKSWADYSGTLSRTLKRHGLTLGSSSRRRVPDGRATMWPFSADALHVGDLDVREYGESDNEDGGDDLEIEP